MNFKKLALVSIICLTAFAGYSQISLGTNFKILTNLPIDTRMVVADLTARDTINSMYRYQGLSVYVRSTGTNYQLVGGIANSNWQAVGIVSNYAAGIGLTLSGNTFFANNTTAIWNANQLNGSNISTTTPSVNQVLQWNGTAWAPAIDANTIYDAGIVLTLSGTTFSHIAHTGDAIGSTSLTVIALQGRNIATTAPGTGEFLGWDGTSWIPTIPPGTTYAAGIGLTLSGNTFNANNTVAIWNANQLNGTSISTIVPTGNQILKWNGSEWAPALETAYTSGIGITISGTTFSADNTAAIWNANQIMGNSISTLAPDTDQILKWNGALWTPAADDKANFAAGFGLLLSGTTFFANNSASIWNAGLIQGNAVTATVPTANQV